jgi:ATP-dependent DNA ligase
VTDGREPISANPRDWRPQTLPVGRYVPEIINPIIEPLWSGTRVIAHFHDSGTNEWGTVEVVDELGEDASAAAPLAVEHLRRSILANEAVLDGILTEQATVSGEGTAVVVFAQSSPVKRLIIGGPESDIKFDPPKGPQRRGEAAFVAIDLLSVDGQTLFDVPLLERKRILEGVIEQSELVRVSPWVRPPVRQWFSSWRAAGFKGLILKSTNSRYTPGSQTNEWARVERMPRS